MERKCLFFKYNQVSLHYSIYGEGSIPIFFFHGFGLTGLIFEELEKVLPTEYIVYNFDLPHHGKTQWKEGEEPITHEFWKELIEAFCKENRIQAFSLLGYSIGARLVWSTALSFPDRVKEIIVMAPDGIKNSLWYSMATGSSFSRMIFKKMLLKNYIQNFLKIGQFFHLAPKITVRFAESQLVTAEQRSRVYYTWVIFRKLIVVPEILGARINQHHIPLTIYLGAQDRIITFTTIESLTNKLKQKNVITLQAGHSNLISKVVEYLKSKQEDKSVS
jgi:pimeloyl-ACP methyl ester carboxylesterase